MKETRRRQTSVEQLALLIDFLSEHKELALGKVRSKEARAAAARLWRQCSLLLNAQGPARTSKEWSKVWNDLKCRVRAKLVSINANQQATGGGPSTAPTLTPLEERVSYILGRDVGPIPNVRQDQLGTNEDDHSPVICDLVVEGVEEQGDNNESNLLIFNNTLGDDLIINPVIQPSPTPSLTGRVPSPNISSTRNRRSRVRARDATIRQRARRTARVNPPPPPAQSNGTALEESRTMVLKIESLRAEAALMYAQNQKILAEAFKILTESVDKLAREYCRRNGGATSD